MSSWNSFYSQRFWREGMTELNLWTGGIGRKASGIRQPQPDWNFASRKKKQKKFKNGIPEGLQNENQSDGSEVWNETAGEWTAEDALSCSQAESQDENIQKSRKRKKKRKKSSKKKTDLTQSEHGYENVNRQQPAQQMKSEGQETNRPFMEKDASELLEILLWSEILGEPVSVKRRKRKADQGCGNQGNADRR